MSVDQDAAEPAPRRTAMVAVNIDDYEHMKRELDHYRRHNREIEERRRAFEAPRIERFREYVRAMDAWLAGDEGAERAWEAVQTCRGLLDRFHDMEGAKK